MFNKTNVLVQVIGDQSITIRTLALQNEEYRKTYNYQQASLTKLGTELDRNTLKLNTLIKEKDENILTEKANDWDRLVKFFSKNEAAVQLAMSPFTREEGHEITINEMMATIEYFISHVDSRYS